MTKAELNARIGRMYYQALTDAAGYPNGMPFWEEMPPKEKYYHTATALDLIDMLAQEALIETKEEVGFNKPADWNKGDCRELMDFFERSYEADLKSLQERIAAMNKRINSVTPDAG